MLIDPEKNNEFKIFLTELYEKMDFLMPRLSQKNVMLLDEYKWAIALDYLLLKSLGENELSKYLYEKIPSTWDEFKYHSDFHLQDGNSKELRRLTQTFKDLYFSFFENNLVNPYVLRNSLFRMRIDRELKILFSLFGGEFFPQEQEIWDGTGAIYFNKSDFKSNPEKFQKKLDIMQNHTENLQSGDIGCIALNIGHHWVAVNSIENEMVSFNDPNTGGRGKIKINKKTPDRYRFYLFSYNPKKAILLDEKIENFLNREIEKELVQIQEFTASLVEKIEKEPAVVSLKQEVENKTKAVISEGERVTVSNKNQVVETSSEDEIKGDVMDRIRKRIKDSFSDYSKL